MSENSSKTLQELISDFEKELMNTQFAYLVISMFDADAFNAPDSVDPMAKSRIKIVRVCHSEKSAREFVAEHSSKLGYRHSWVSEDTARGRLAEPSDKPFEIFYMIVKVPTDMSVR